MAEREFSEGTESVLIRREKNLQLDNNPTIYAQSASPPLLSSPQRALWSLTNLFGCRLRVQGGQCVFFSHDGDGRFTPLT